MTATLQEAIAAVRDGNTERAQLLAAEVIQDNPDDAQAWYLLSQLVDSDARRAAYLGKTLALDPNHERARAEFAMLPAEAGTVLGVPVPAAAAVAATGGEWGVSDELELPPTAEPADVPDWLQPLSPESPPVTVALADEPAVASVELPTLPPAPSTLPVAPPVPTTSAPRRQSPPPPPARQQGNGALMALLVLLVLLTLAVLAILAYLLLF